MPTGALRDLCDARLGKRPLSAHVEYVGPADVAVVAKNKRFKKAKTPGNPLALASSSLPPRVPGAHLPDDSGGMF
jgi:hypothetical protein